MSNRISLLLGMAITVLLVVSQAAANPRGITIGKLTYVGTHAQTSNEGTVIPVSGYELSLETTGITMEPISFRNAELFVKGAVQHTGAITTGLGCGLPPYKAPCQLLFLGGPHSAGYTLPPCAKLNSEQGLTQTCISIAIQLVSPTGKNFGFTLVNGRQFCAYGINNIFLLGKPNQDALQPQCDAEGFCKGDSVPVILRAAPAKTCVQ